MKGIFKIEEYLPLTNQIVVKFSRLNSPKPIDEHKSISGPVVLDDLVGKVIEGNVTTRSKSLLKMRRVEL